MNWQELIGEIRKCGISQVQLAKQCGCHQSTISDLETGKAKNPRFTLGEAIRNVHRKHCGRKGRSQ